MADKLQSDARAARLAAELRANLVRRKARDLAEPPPKSDSEPGAAR